MLHTLKTETKTFPIPPVFVDDTEALIGAATAPSNPTYDTATTGQFNCDTRTGTGTTANIFWTIIRLPTGYVNAGNLTVSVDDIYTLGGDAVIVASTIDLEAYLYDSTNGDFSNTDINATAAQAITTTVATDSFTITGTTLAAGDTILLRFTSSIQITSAGAAGTGVNGFNNFRYTATCRV